MPKVKGRKGNRSPSLSSQDHMTSGIGESTDCVLVSSDEYLSRHEGRNGTGSLSRGNSSKYSNISSDYVRSPVKATVKKHYDHSIIVNYQAVKEQILVDEDPNMTNESIHDMIEAFKLGEDRSKMSSTTQGSPKYSIAQRLFNSPSSTTSHNDVYIVDIPIENGDTDYISEIPNGEPCGDNEYVGDYSSLERSFPRYQSLGPDRRVNPSSPNTWQYSSLRSPTKSTCDWSVTDGPVVKSPLQQTFFPNVRSTPKQSVTDGHFLDVDNTSYSDYASLSDASSPARQKTRFETSFGNNLDKTVENVPSKKMNVSAIKAKLESRMHLGLSSKSEGHINLSGKDQPKSQIVRNIVKRFESGACLRNTNDKSSLRSPSGSPSRASRSATLPGRQVKSLYSPPDDIMTVVEMDSAFSDSRLAGSEPLLYTDEKLTPLDCTGVEPVVQSETEPRYVQLSCSASGYTKFNKFTLKGVENSNSGLSVKDDITMGNKNSSSIEKDKKFSPPVKTGAGKENIEPQSLESKASVQPQSTENKLNGHPGVTDSSTITERNKDVIENREQGKESLIVNGISHTDVTLNCDVEKAQLDSSDNHKTVLKKNKYKHGLNEGGNNSLRETQYIGNIETTGLQVKSCSVPDSPSDKDGKFYLNVVSNQTIRLQGLSKQVEKYMEDNTLPEDACGKIRAAAGKANLLISQKFEQFKELCHKNLTPSPDDPFTTTSEDLAGFWDMVDLQVEDVISEIRDIEEMKLNNWVEPERKPQRIRRTSSGSSQQGSSSATNVSHSKVASSTGARTKTSKTKDGASSARSKEMAKAREEARKRLKAAKEAMRKRFSSGEEIEIFVPGATHSQDSST